MTNKILISRELLDEFRRYTEAGVPQQGSWGHDLLQKLRTALTAPQQEAVATLIEPPLDSMRDQFWVSQEDAERLNSGAMRGFIAQRPLE